MSNFHTDTNKGRVAKMCDTVGLLQKSAKSNRATPEEINELMLPLVDALRDLGVTVVKNGDFVSATVDLASGEVTAAEKTAPPRHPRAWTDGRPDSPAYATLHDLALNAPFADIGPALAVLTTRLDEALCEAGKGGSV